MALYAFDGTWNDDENPPTKNTNVVKFCELYPGTSESMKYLDGVGTRFGVTGRIFGGIFGAGGKERIKEMYSALKNRWNNGDQHIDIIGFSRGGALAVHFANKIASDGINGVIPPIRFLGVWDIVGSFGIPVNAGINFHDINLGWNIDSIPDCVQNCFHAMALDERRQVFDITRLINADGNRVQECWFRGVHSDVGGGNGNIKLSSISLKWMLENAKNSGVNISDNDIAKIAQKNDPTAKISKNFDLVENQYRIIKTSDTFHVSAAKKLAVNEEITFVVSSREKYNWSGIVLEQDATYEFQVADSEKWTDGDIECLADGWKTQDLDHLRGRAISLLSLENKRRFPTANWFELIGALGSDGNNYFRIGKGVNYKAPIGGGLFTFANDIDYLYNNNYGKVSVKIRRVT